MKKIILVATTLLMVIGITGCGDKPKELVAGVQYFPAGEGYTWEYRVISKDTTWTAPNIVVVVADTSYYTVTCSESEMNDGTPAWEFKEVGDDGTSYVYVWIGDTEIEIYDSKSDTEPETMPAEIKVNISWDQAEYVEVGDLGSGTTVAAYTVESDEEVTVPAGTFTALKATAKSSVSVGGTVNVDAEFSEWYDADAGLVKRVSTAENDVAGVTYTGAMVTEELMEYNTQ
ncbi:hypothetical protein JXM67_09795 [candidate division WOR-3 bacterium]|nr:hypothetical protein [candidate division WOR-3 bacterium]